MILDVSELLRSLLSLISLETDGCTSPLWGMGPSARRRRLGTTADRGQATYVLTVSTTSSEKCGPTSNGGWRVIEAKNNFFSNEHRKEADVIASVWQIPDINISAFLDYGRNTIDMNFDNKNCVKRGSVLKRHNPSRLAQTICGLMLLLLLLLL